MDIEFGQPFADRAEAMAFLAHYDRGRRTPEERSARLDRELVSRPDGSLYLPHTKKISLIVYPVPAGEESRTSSRCRS